MHSGGTSADDVLARRQDKAAETTPRKGKNAPKNWPKFALVG